MKLIWHVLIYSILGIAALIAFLVGFSFSLVHINELVILYDAITQEVVYDQKYKEPGAYFIGLSKSFIRFPANNILVEYMNTINDNSTENLTVLANQILSNNSLTCWTSDGLDVLIDISYYYTLNRTNLVWFYREFGDRWIHLMEIMGSKAIKETSVQYSSEFYYINRTLLHISFQNALQKAYNIETNYSVIVNYLQIQSIQFFQGFENSIVSKLVQQHYYNLYNYQGQIDLINVNTSVFSNNTYNQINITKANATAIGIENDFILKSQALVYYLQNMTTAYNSIRTNLGLSWSQMFPLIYAIELKTATNLNKNITFVPRTVQRVMETS